MALLCPCTRCKGEPPRVSITTRNRHLNRDREDADKRAAAENITSSDEEEAELPDNEYEDIPDGRAYEMCSSDDEDGNPIPRIYHDSRPATPMDIDENERREEDLGSNEDNHQDYPPGHRDTSESESESESSESDEGEPENAIQDEDVNQDEDELDPERQEEEEHIRLYSTIDCLRFSQQYIEAIQDATLENSGLQPQTIYELRNPSQTIDEDLDDQDTRLALEIFISCLHASEATYTNVIKATARRFPEMEQHSYYSVKKLFERATGVIALATDMCVNSCHAFTGPDTELEACRICGESRYDEKRLPKKIPRKTFCTLPLGPQIQALRRSPENAVAMEYQYEQFRKREENGNTDTIYDDIQSGSDVHELFKSIGLNPNDTTLIFSLDGAQLYQNKQSDTWIAIWILPNYSPKIRYQKKYVLPALIIPGPNKPKNLDSFLLVGFCHLSALQKENEGRGLAIWNAHENRITYSRLILLLGTADAVGLTELDGRVGHHGAHGCRLGCTMKGRHKPRSGHYFSAHLRPHGTTNMEPDFDFRNPEALEPSLIKYDDGIERIIGSTSQAEYEENRKDTGLSKLSLLSGLNQNLMLPVPTCFSVDLMHLVFINLGELLIPLWRGTLLCEPSDSKISWEWATLNGDTWIAHGALVANATKYFPSSFHRPPRNPAEKISSGYKATEYYLYLFGLGPSLFRCVLPPRYYLNFCRLVAAVHIILQRAISKEDLLKAHRLLVQFVEEYENLYYQRRPDRLHMCRPCLHTLLHVVFEVFRKGPGALDSQFTLERTIGDLGSDIRQPSNPFGNLIQLALKRAQINALYAIVPEIDTFQRQLPKGSMDVGNGFVFLRPRDRHFAKPMPNEEHLIYTTFGIEKIRRWGRMLLPNGQVVRSMRAENHKKSRSNLRVARNVKISHGDTIRFAEVQFYFALPEGEGHYALVSLYGTQNLGIWQESLNTLYACPYYGQDSLIIIQPKDIISLISMQPMQRKPTDPENLWFVVEKSGLEMLMSDAAGPQPVPDNDN